MLLSKIKKAFKLILVVLCCLNSHAASLNVETETTHLLGSIHSVTEALPPVRPVSNTNTQIVCSILKKVKDRPLVQGTTEISAILIPTIASARIFLLSGNFGDYINNLLGVDNPTNQATIRYLFATLAYIPGFALSRLSVQNYSDWLIDTWESDKRLKASSKYKWLSLQSVLNVIAPLHIYYLSTEATEGMGKGLEWFIKIPALLSNYLIVGRSMDLLTSRLITEFVLARNTEVDLIRLGMLQSVSQYFSQLEKDEVKIDDFLNTTSRSENYNEYLHPILSNYQPANIKSRNLGHWSTYVAAIIIGGFANYATYIQSQRGAKMIFDLFGAPEWASNPLSCLLGALSTEPQCIISIESTQRVLNSAALLLYNSCSKENLKCSSAKCKDFTISAASGLLGFISSVSVLYGSIISTNQINSGIGWCINLCSFFSSGAIRAMAVYDLINKIMFNTINFNCGNPHQTKLRKLKAIHRRLKDIVNYAPNEVILGLANELHLSS